MTPLVLSLEPLAPSTHQYQKQYQCPFTASIFIIFLTNLSCRVRNLVMTPLVLSPHTNLSSKYLSIQYQIQCHFSVPVSNRVAGVCWLSGTAAESRIVFGERIFANFRDKNIVFYNCGKTGHLWLSKDLHTHRHVPSNTLFDV